MSKITPGPWLESNWKTGGKEKASQIKLTSNFDIIAKI